MPGDLIPWAAFSGLPEQETDVIEMSAEVQALCERLAESAAAVDQAGKWPAEQMQWLAEAGVFRWFVPEEFGGLGWDESQILQGYLALSQSCLTTTFVLTQWNAACKRLVGSANSDLKSQWLPKLASGEVFATVGISHLSTSRQHIKRPVLQASADEDGGFTLNGYSPWITAGEPADLLVVGATLDDGREIIAAVPTSTAGVVARQPADLVALTSSCTGQVDFEAVQIDASAVVAGPVENVMQTNTGGGTGGLQTSTLAVGLSCAAAGFLRKQAMLRPDLSEVAEKMHVDASYLVGVLEQLAAGVPAELDAAGLRQQANSLVLRSTQAALSAAKGAGFLSSHAAGRWAREALFFLVWSCPQSVVSANLCELAQLEH